MQPFGNHDLAQTSSVRILFAIALLAATPWTASEALAQRRGAGAPQNGGATGEDNVVEAPTTAGIAWFGSYAAGLAEAKRTDRPILLMSAAPQCHGVPGMW